MTKTLWAPSSYTRLAVLAVVAMWLLAAAVLPTAQDESYYYLWSKYLDFGYFDHPPLVALMALPSQWANGHAFVARLGTLAVGIATLCLSVRLFRKLGVTDDRSLATVVVASHMNFLGLIYGFLTTPDTVLLFSWVLTLHELVAALKENPKRWVTAGIAAGFGLLSKYTMVLIGLVALIGGRKHLRTRWPWAGVAAAVLIFSPHLWWNAQNDWITVKFQLRHGLALARPAMPGRVLPEPLPQIAGSPEVVLAQGFSPLRASAAVHEKKKRFYDDGLELLNRYIGFYASQIALWGVLAPFLLFWMWRGRRGWARQLDSAGVDPDVRPLLVAATLVPLVIFGVLSLVAKVEANWSGMYVLGAAVLLLPFARAHQRAVVTAAAANAVILMVLLAHSRLGFLPIRPFQDRILRETHGYNSLAERLQTLDGPVFGDSFQIVSMVSFARPDLFIRQWPGITRDSELVRRPEMNGITQDDLMARGAFWLVTTDERPPRLPGFNAVDLLLLRDCKFGGIQEIRAPGAAETANRCKDPVHEWYLVHYQVSGDATTRDPRLREQGARHDG